MSTTEPQRGIVLENLSLADMLWHQAMATYRHQSEWRQSQVAVGQQEDVLFYLINRGLVDASALDGPWHSSTRSMRYAATLTERLWSLVEYEQVKVRVILLIVGEEMG
jgi:hypothetical protein